MIKLEKIRYQNFLSTGNSFNEIDLTRKKTTLIVGENGAGKSTLIDALSFVLYNKAYRNVNKPQLVNSITAKDCLVEIEFKIGTNEYVVRRGIKPAIFEIYKNDKLVNQSSENKDYQKFLEESILKMNHKTFCQIVILGSANFVPFMQLPAQSRRSVIEDLLDIQIFSLMNSLLKEKVNTNKSQLLNNDHSLDLIESKLDLSKKHIEELQTNNSNLIEEKQKRISEYYKNIDLLQKELIEIKEKCVGFSEIVQKHLKATKKNAQQEVVLDSLSTKIERLNDTLYFYQHTTTCQTCKQNITESFKTNAIIETNTTKGEIEKSLIDLSNIIQKTKIDINNYKNEIETFNIQQKREIEINSSISNSRRIINELEKEIVFLKNKNISIIENDTIDKLQEQLKTLQIEKQELITNREILNAASILLKDGGIKSKIIKQYIPIINKLINKYLASMDFFVQFELDENFNEKIKSRFRDEFSYESFSEGEKVRLDLALLFAWRAVTKLRNSASTNLLILDEIFDGSLDLNGTEEFLKILNTLPNETNVFVISHKTDQMIDKFETVIRFSKIKNFSKVVE